MLEAADHAAHGHAAHALHAGVAGAAGAVGAQRTGLLASLVHALAYLFVAGGIAVIVYRRFGLRLLRTAWFNLEYVWIAALLVSAVAVAWPNLRWLS